MTNLNCIITDDEPIALEILEDYIRQVPGLNVVSKCSDAMETLAAMRKEKIDVLFIDIQMPGITGIDYIKTMRNPPVIVLTTAYPQYAIDGFDLDVTDYLLKPFSFERFIKAIDKIYGKAEHRSFSELPIAGEEPQSYFFVKSNRDLIKVHFADILYLEGMENYVRIHCENCVITALAKMKNMEVRLPVDRFMRIHKSFIVNLEKVTSIKNLVFNIKNKEIDTGNFYRKNVQDFIKNSSQF
jgi:DNA-binding LytR/AlgR family response regulator